MTVTIDDDDNGTNSGNNSDKFELVLESEQYMTVAIPAAARQLDDRNTAGGWAGSRWELDKVSITIVGPLEWREFLASMRAISKE